MKRAIGIFSVTMLGMLSLGCSVEGNDSDPKGPRVVSVSPANGATGISAETNKLVVTFSEPMGLGYSFCEEPGSPIVFNGKGSWISSTTVEIPVILSPGIRYQLSLNDEKYTNFKNRDGTALEPYLWTFTTGGEPDRILPTVATLFPSNGSAGVDPRTTELRVTFSEVMNTGYAFTRTIGTYPPTTGKAVWTDRYTITLPVSLSPDTTYTLGLNGAGYMAFWDSAGNALEPVVWTFTTGSI